PPRELVAEEAHRARPGVEVEELRDDAHARRLPGEEHGHHGDDRRDDQSIAEKETEVELDPALRDHGAASVSPRRRSVVPSSRNTSPSAPTATPCPPGVNPIDRIQFAASWIGTGATVHVAPPSSLRRIVPALPTIQPYAPATATS